MTSIITLNIDKSTKASPLKFFEKFYTEENIKRAYPNYLEKMPDLTNPNAWWGQFPVEVDLFNKTWTIEYEFEISWDESEGSTYEKRIKQFTFETEFDNLLRCQYHKTIGFLKEKLKNAKNDKSRKDTIKTFIDKCLIILGSLKNKNWSINKGILARPIRALIRICYTNYNDFCPNQKIDLRIGEILKERESSAWLYETSSLLPKLADEILNIKDLLGDSIIKYDDERDREKLKLFLSKKFSDIKNYPIKLIGPVGIVSYFLSEVILNSGLQLIQAEEKKMFSINGSNFFANYASNERYRIADRNELIKLDIDKAILAHSF